MQLLDHLRHLVALDHLFFQAVEQPVALRVAHAELEVGSRQGFLVAIDVGRMQQRVQVALVVEHQAQVDLRLGLEVLVDRAFADTDCISDHLDGDTVFTLFEKQLERGIEDFLFATAKLTDLTRFFLHGKDWMTLKRFIMPNLQQIARIIQPCLCFTMSLTRLRGCAT
ncbi:hypothetical protein D3C78_1344570 [compost metagenome]